MDEKNGDKGFKVVDRRSMPDPEPEAGTGAAAGQPSPGGEGETAPASGSGGAAPGGAPVPPEAGGPTAGRRPPGFLDLLQSLQFSAMLHLGMVQDPEGKRSEVDLPAAKDAIDMMDVIKEKTKGNLTAEEDGMLTEGLYVLRMSYLAARNAEKKEGGGVS